MSYVPPHLRGEGDDDGDEYQDGEMQMGVESEGAPEPESPQSQGQKVVSTTCVYVEFLPFNTTVEECAHEFGQCGELEMDDAGKPRIKLYRFPDGSLKGDGLVNYKTTEGAESALENMDGRPLRMYGDDDDDAMVVTMAFFEAKGKKQNKQNNNQNYNQGHGTSNNPGAWRQQSGEPRRVEHRQPADDSFYDLPPKHDKPKGKPKPVVDDDGWETVGSVRADSGMEEPKPAQPVAPTKPVVAAEKPKATMKISSSVVSIDGNILKGWGDDSSDEDETEDEFDEPAGPVEIDDIEGIDDMTGAMQDDTDSEDDEVKEKRRQDAQAAKEAAATQKQKAKKGNKRGGLSKKEQKELKQKQDEEFERLLTQAVREVQVDAPLSEQQASADTDTASTPTTPAVSETGSVTPPEVSEPLDKAAAAKAAKNKKRKETQKKKMKEEALRKEEMKKKEGAADSTTATAKPAQTLTPKEVLALKKEKRAKKDAKLIKDRQELNAKKMAVQKRAKEQRAKQSAVHDQSRREKFHFSTENSSGCDAG